MRFSETTLPSNKKFGLFFSLIFSFLGIYYLIKLFNIFSSIFFIIAFILFVISFTAPFLLSPLNRTWMFIGYLLGRLVSPIILGLIFFALITPIAFILRIFGRYELRIKKYKVRSYWLNRKTTDLNIDSFNDQF